MLRRALGLLIVILAVLVALPLALVPIYAIPIVHPVSTLMLADWMRFRPVTRDWMPIEDISPVLVRTVMLSEDGQYCSHRGVDWRELNGVIDDALDGEETRGASTIPMQTAKNLFLWTSRSFVRKGLEVPLALYADLILTKPRLMEIYLNVAEFGEGIYGVEAASWHYFDKPAFALTSREAALLAKTLPAPSKRNPARPSRLLAQMASRIEVRTRNAGSFSDCVAVNERQAQAGPAGGRLPGKARLRPVGRRRRRARDGRFDPALASGAAFAMGTAIPVMTRWHERSALRPRLRSCSHADPQSCEKGAGEGVAPPAAAFSGD